MRKLNYKVLALVGAMALLLGSCNTSTNTEQTTIESTTVEQTTEAEVEETTVESTTAETEATTTEETTEETLAEGTRAPAPLEGPIYAGYFRTWHDKAAYPERPNSIADVPAEVDIVFVFPDMTPDDSPFWPALRDEYIPSLHEQGTLVVYTQGLRTMLNRDYPHTPEGTTALVQDYIDFLNDMGMDGFDIDMEDNLTDEELERSIAIIEEFAKHLGPQSGDDGLLIYDTNRNAGTDLFKATHHNFDYVLLQAYGRPLASLGQTWLGYNQYIKPEQFLIGFSFYEEGDVYNLWEDTNEPFEESRAYMYARWQPPQGDKGGIFAYAIDRDWNAVYDDETKLATYEWSKALKQVMLEQAGK